MGRARRCCGFARLIYIFRLTVQCTVHVTTARPVCAERMPQFIYSTLSRLLSTFAIYVQCMM